jgi:hypothetical protein
VVRRVPPSKSREAAAKLLERVLSCLQSWPDVLLAAELGEFEGELLDRANHLMELAFGGPVPKATVRAGCSCIRHG